MVTDFMVSGSNSTCLYGLDNYINRYKFKIVSKITLSSPLLTYLKHTFILEAQLAPQTTSKSHKEIVRRIIK